jgi:hypothetical protein
LEDIQHTKQVSTKHHMIFPQSPLNQHSSLGRLTPPQKNLNNKQRTEN